MQTSLSYRVYLFNFQSQLSERCRSKVRRVQIVRKSLSLNTIMCSCTSLVWGILWRSQDILYNFNYDRLKHVVSISICCASNVVNNKISEVYDGSLNPQTASFESWVDVFDTSEFDASSLAFLTTVYCNGCNDMVRHSWQFTKTLAKTFISNHIFGYVCSKSQNGSPENL